MFLCYYFHKNVQCLNYDYQSVSMSLYLNLTPSNSSVSNAAFPRLTTVYILLGDMVPHNKGLNQHIYESLVDSMFFTQNIWNSTPGFSDQESLGPSEMKYFLLEIDIFLLIQNKRWGGIQKTIIEKAKGGQSHSFGSIKLLSTLCLFRHHLDTIK